METNWHKDVEYLREAGLKQCQNPQVNKIEFFICLEFKTEEEMELLFKLRLADSNS